jgi:DNA repair protein RecO (recombination protein O)
LRTELHPAFVLHQRAYRETSLLLEIFSAQHGRLGLIARGARRGGPRKNLAPRAFTPLLVAWSGKGELPSLSLAEAAGAPLDLQGSRLISGLYLNELLLRLLPRHEPYGELFEDYGEALHALAGVVNPEPGLRIFEIQLMRALGYGMVLDRSVDAGAPIHADHTYFYQADRGPWLEKPERAKTVAVRGSALQALGSQRLEDPEVLREAKHLMRFVLGHHLGSVAIHSRELFQTPFFPE